MMEHINEMKAAGRLVVRCIPKGLTSAMQVCDLIGNKTLKQFMRYEYCSWRAEKIAEEQRKNNNQLKQIKLKVPCGSMLKFIE